MVEPERRTVVAAEVVKLHGLSRKIHPPDSPIIIDGLELLLALEPPSEQHQWRVFSTGEFVTDVPGLFCYRCPRPLNFDGEFSLSTPLPKAHLALGLWLR